MTASGFSGDKSNPRRIPEGSTGIRFAGMFSNAVQEECPISKALFGSAHMLPGITAIAAMKTNEFTAPQIEAVTGLGASTVHDVISRLLQAHLIYRTGSTTTDRVVRYVPQYPEVLDAMAEVRNARAR